ncbi:MAG: molybdopterin-binding protein [Pseudomonadota bacterium]
MKFGPVAVADAEGAVLAHSLAVAGGRLRKGRVLSAGDIADLAAAGHVQVIVARAAPDEIGEDAAAAALAAAILQPGCGLTAEAPFTGRVNIRAEGAGIVAVDAEAVEQVNAIHEAITLATLPPLQRVTAGMMVATVKIIPYAAPSKALDTAESAAPGALRLLPPVIRSAGLIVTQIDGRGGKTSSDTKGVAAIRARLDALGVALAGIETVPHEASAVGEALLRLPGELALILTASATSDAEDVGPAGLIRAGGALIRFGMPVDPGNLLFLGERAGQPVIGLPGCARSPALNGADWVLERVICGVAPDAASIAAMGVGGLLKEIPTRPQPRERRPR